MLAAAPVIVMILVSPEIIHLSNITLRHTNIGADANTLQTPASQDKIEDSYDFKVISARLDRGKSSSSQGFLEEVNVSSLVIFDRHYLREEILGEIGGKEIIQSKILESLSIEGVLKMLECESAIFWSTSERVMKED